MSYAFHQQVDLPPNLDYLRGRFFQTGLKGKKEGEK